MNEYPRISIVTPSLNQGKYIEKTILSVLNQNYPNLEYIIIDGGSSDNTLEIIKKYESKLAYWVSEEDTGQSNAVNKGFYRSSGDIVAWINSDDIYCENIFNRIVEYFNNNIMWLYGNSYFIDESENIIAYKRPVKFNSFVLKFGSFSFNQPSVFFRRKIFNEIGYLRDDFHAIMDQEWFCRIAEKYKPLYVDIDIAKFRWHSSSKSSSGKTSAHYQKLIHERQYIFEKYLPNFSFIHKKYPEAFFLIFNFIARIIKLYYRILRILWMSKRF